MELHRHAAALVSAFACAGSLACASAQEAEQATGIVEYPASFFVEFNALTALDMVERVPGFSFDPGSDVRGLGGSFGNVLINGQRPSVKGDALISLLRNIAAANVISLEFVRGSAAELDMRGQNRVVNVVLVTGADRSGAYEFRLSRWGGDRIVPTGNASMSSELAGTSINLGIDLDGHGRRFIERRYDFDAVGIALLEQHERNQRSYREVRPNFSLERAFANGDSIRVNGRYAQWVWNQNDTRLSYLPQRAEPDAYQFGTGGSDARSWTLGGDYERRFSPTLTGKLITYNQRGEYDTRTSFEGFDRVGTRNETQVEQGDESGESILRSTLTWTPRDTHTFAASAEVAYNFLDGYFRLFVDDGTGPREIDLPVSETRVEEVRFETGLNHVWRARPNLTLESELLVEFSTIEQTGDASEERSFVYPKPSITATWDVTPQDQLRFVIRRTVGQLDFGDFVSSVEIANDQTNIGNPQLEPERSWRISGGWERRLGNDSSFNALLAHSQIEAVEGLVPISNGTRFFDGPGNLGDGTQTTLDLSATLSLDRFGIPGGVLEPSLFLRRTRVTDPLTGETRSFARRENWRGYVEFRQDLPEHQFSWGFDYFIAGPETDYRVAELINIDQPTGDLDIFVETTRWFGVTARIGADWVIDSNFHNERLFYAPDRRSGVVDRVQQRDFEEGTLFYAQISGTF